MTGAGRPLSWSEIEDHLVEVGAELERRGLTRSIVVVGGAYVASRGVRASTTDVDTVDELDDELRNAIAVWPTGTDSTATGSTIEPVRGDRPRSTREGARRFSTPVVSRSSLRHRTSSS
ncbi:MAG: hypothetical protein F2534_20795 [Actinobacteria bacterium]|jgi:hypothetical protein|uniref:Unannotated protein n=1 Tax=freshwater metagenome TaxID=449393 RepID=A0A6J6G717_9ZZZZ|nr:hypothetical protein [Actinomycetota bacterium]